MILHELFEHKQNNDYQMLLETLVLSSWIWDITWDEDNQTIRMTTKNKKNGAKKTYVLHGLTEEIANRWIKSNSKGKFWHRLIKHIIVPGNDTNTPAPKIEPEPTPAPTTTPASAPVEPVEADDEETEKKRNMFGRFFDRLIKKRK